MSVAHPGLRPKQLDCEVVVNMREYKPNSDRNITYISIHTYAVVYSVKITHVVVAIFRDLEIPVGYG